MPESIFEEVILPPGAPQESGFDEVQLPGGLEEVQLPAQTLQQPDPATTDLENTADLYAEQKERFKRQQTLSDVSVPPDPFAAKEWNSQIDAYAKHRGIDPVKARALLADHKLLDFESHAEDAGVLHNGAVVVRPGLAFDEAKWKAAVENTNAGDLAKQQALLRRQEIKESVAENMYPLLYRTQKFREYESKNDGKFKTTGELVEAFRRENEGAGSNLGLQAASGITSGIEGLSKSIYGAAATVFRGGIIEEMARQAATDEAEQAAVRGALGGGQWLGKLSQGAISLAPAFAGGAATQAVGLAGRAALTAQAGIAGAQSFGGTYTDALQANLAKGMDSEEARTRAIAPAIASGWATALVTKGFSGGIETIASGAKREAAKGILKERLKTYAKEIGVSVTDEAAEETTDQALQGIIEANAHNPSLSIPQAFAAAVEAGVLGGILGGVASGAKAISEEQTIAAERLKKAGAKATADAVKSNPKVAAALTAITAKRDYAAEAKAKLEETQPPPPTVEEIPTVDPNLRAGPTPPPSSEASEDIQYPEWETAGGQPTISEREDGSVAPPPEVEASIETDPDDGGVPVERVASAAIASRPDLMQFKRTDDSQTGVNETDRLEGQWDDRKAGNLLLWEPKNPEEHGLAPGQRYIVANGHHRKEFGDRAGVPAFNSQVVREEDGYSAQDARRLGAEINIADGKGTIHDQAKYLRDTAATLGADEALEIGRRIGAKGRKAATIAFSATDPLFYSFVNEQISPEHAEVIASAAPNNEGLQRVGMRAATREGMSPAMVASAMAAVSVRNGGEAETGDLFGTTDAAINEAIRQAKVAAAQWTAINKRIQAISGAGKNPQIAAEEGVDVKDPEAIPRRIEELKRERDRWGPYEWFKHPDLVAITRGDPPPPTPNQDGRQPTNGSQLPTDPTEPVKPARIIQEDPDFLTGTPEEPFNLISETRAERFARERAEQEVARLKEESEIAAAKAKADRDQQTLFAAPEALPSKYSVGSQLTRNGRVYRITRDMGSHVQAVTVTGGISIVIQKDNGLPMQTVQRLVNLAKARLSNFLVNVGHPQTVLDGTIAGATMYVGVLSDGEPRIFVNWNEVASATAGMTEEEAGDRIYTALSEEIVHVAEVRYQASNPGATQQFLDWINNPEAAGHDPAFVTFLRQTYTGFDQLAPYQKAAEASRVIIQRRWIGRITEAVKGYLSGLADYLQRFVTGVEETPPFVQAYIKGIEDILFGRAGTSNATAAVQKNASDALMANDGNRAAAIAMLEKYAGVSRQKGDTAAADNLLNTSEYLKSNQGTIRANSNQQVNDLFRRAAEGDESAFEELDRIKRERYGDPTAGRPGESRGQRFTSAQEFEKFFEIAYGKRDFDAILNAIKASDNAIYTPLLKRLFKEQKTSAEAANRAEWLRAVFNGTVPPDAKVQPTPTSAPPPKTTPTPTQQPRGQSGFTGPGFNVPPPPPPPPKPQGKHPFSMPALVLIANRLGTMPRINKLLKRVRGRFVMSGPPPIGVRIELNEHLFKNPRQAARTLAHEIGHFFDFIPMAVSHAGLAEKVAPLKDWRKIFGPLWDWSGHKISEIQQLLKTEAIQVSRGWRGDFGPGDRYRNSASELYADFLSAVMNDPDWAFRVAPRLSAAFFAGLEQKPAVHEAYNVVNELIRGDTLLKVLRAEQEEAGKTAVARMINLAIKRVSDLTSARRAWVAFYGGFLNRYGPTMQKAGGYWKGLKARMADFGHSYVEEQEVAATFSDRNTYLMHDRLNAGTYLPLSAAGIDTSNLDTYLRNRRIIHERTATGVWLQQNPDEARDLFKWMATEAGLEARWHDQIDNADDADLYDLGARLVYDLHEQQAFDTVFRAAQRRGAPDFAERGLFAFDVSGFMLNPQGIDPEAAQKQISEIAAELGADRFRILQEAAKNYYDTMREIVLHAQRLGLFRPTTWAERIAPNLGNYVPFMVIDYFTGHITASVSPPRKGTARDVMPTHIAGQLKMAAMLRRMQRQKQALLAQNFYRTEGKAFGFDSELRIHSERLTDQQQSEIRRNGRGLMGFYQQGEWRWMEFEDGASIQALEQFDPEDLGTILAIGRAQSNFWRLLFTTYSVAFTLWNALRTVHQSWASHGMKNIVNLAKSFPQAKQYADAVVRGTPLTPELRALVKSAALPAPDQSLAGQGSPELLEKMILAGVVNAEHMVNRTPHAHQSAIMRFLRMPLGWAFDGIAYVSGIVESIPKIATERTLRERGSDAKQAAAFARLEGIPNPGISGKYNTAMEVALMFARVHIQGLRALRTRAMSPQTRGGFLMRAMLSQFITKGFYVACAGGAIDALVKAIRGGGDDDEQVDFQEFVNRSTPYKLEMDDLLFLGWVKPDGGWEPPFGHKSIPADWTPLTIRIPHSEDGRYISPVTSVALTTAMKSSIRPVDVFQRTVQLGQAVIPGVNPGLDLVSAAWQIDNDAPPQDTYRGLPIVAKDEWDAGPMSRLWGLTKHFAKTIGVPGMQQRIENPNLNWFWNGVRNIPGLGRLTPLDNYGGVREQRRHELEETRINARARNMRGKDTVQAMYRINALEAKGANGSEKPTARTEGEEEEYRHLRTWYNDYYQGTKDAPGLFHTLKAKAAGVPNVDSETAKEYLDATAKMAMEEGKSLRDQ